MTTETNINEQPMDINKQPGISFDSIILVRENFWREAYVPKDHDIQIDFNLELNTDDSSNTYYCLLKFKLDLLPKDTKNNNPVLSIESEFVGEFSIIESQQNMDIVYFMENSAPAIMYPYVREHVSSLTNKSGIGSILLPPINLQAIKNSIKK